MSAPEGVSSPMDHAVHWASQGYHVFPVFGVTEGRCDCGNEKCGSPGKHPLIAKWPENASDSPEQVTTWKAKHPNANFGVATGNKSHNLFVLDIDAKNDGHAALRALESIHGPLPVTFTVATSRRSGASADTQRGEHRYFRIASGSIPRNSAGVLGPGIDTRGEGGYVVGVGSQHASGERYELAVNTHLAEAPAWLLEAATPKKPSAAPKPSGVSPSKIPEGTRHKTLLRIANGLFRRGLSREAVLAELRHIDATRCVPALDDKAALMKLVSDCEEFMADKDRDLRPEIPGGDEDLFDVLPAAWDALAEANTPTRLVVYGQQVSAVQDDERGMPCIRALDAPGMEVELARAARWRKTTAKGEVRFGRPPAIAQHMLGMTNSPLPRLNRVVEHPAFDATGTLHDTNGFNESTGNWHAIDARVSGLKISPNPSKGDVAASVQLLREELLGDFPFVNDADRANCMALLLLPFVRDVIDGPTPLHLLEKPCPGSGASLAVDAITTIVTGRAAVGIVLGRDETETHKIIVSKLLTAPSVVAIDNAVDLASPSLAAALTLECMEGRLLGKSKMVRFAQRAAWAATGNNPRLTSEIARRTVAIRLDSGHERPWDRKPSEFRHPDLRTWVRGKRRELLTACLTIIRAWVVAGMPRGAKSLGGMEAWAGVMGGILEVAEIPGFLDNRERFHERADDEAAPLRALVQTWAEEHGERAVGVADLYRLADSPSIGLDLGNGNDRSRQTRLGSALSRINGRRFGDFKVTQAGKKSGARQWQLVNMVNPVNLLNVSKPATTAFESPNMAPSEALPTVCGASLPKVDHANAPGN